MCIRDRLAGGLAYLQTKYSRPFKVASAKWGAPWSGPLNLDGKETTLYAYPEGGNSKLPFMVSVDLSTTPITFHDYYAVPVSYTHLDVYKRQAEKGTR